MVFNSIKKRFSKKEKPEKTRVRVSKKSEKRYKMEVEQIFKELSSKADINKRYAVMGIGNDLKGDDGIGWYVVERLKAEFAKDENLLFIKTAVPENHVREVREFAPKLLIIVDAADFKKKSGTIKIVKEYQVRASALSSHTSPITLFLRLYQRDMGNKAAVTIIGIQKGNNEFGQPVSDVVKKSGDNVVRIIAMLYRNNYLDISIEKELENLTSPFKRIINYFRGD